MRTIRKDAPLLTLEESILVDKLQEILHKHSPPTRCLSSATKKVEPRRSTRKSISITQIAKVANTLTEVFKTAERCALWDDDRISAKKSTKQEDQPTKRSGQRSDGFSNRNKDKRRSHPQRGHYGRIELHQVRHPYTSNLAPCERQTLGEKIATFERRSEQEGYSKYCAFHGTHEHTMNNCFAWKAQLEELVREGHCTKFIAKQAIQQIKYRDTTKELPQKVIRINTILVDSEESGLTSKKKKSKIKQAIVVSQILTDLPHAEDDPVIGFQKKDMIGLDMPHNDALVISIQIAQAMVDRIHADEGSTTNILQLAVIQQMGLETKINKSARSLTGLNGATTVTIGTTDLDVYSPPIISSQIFMVINEVSPYNGILGRPLIGKINAITSTTHQKIRYPIPRGCVSQINSDQTMARKWSAQRLKKSKQAQFLPVSQADLKEVEQPNLAPL
ncbi:PREDICTED: uncharacterized protein LOC107880286 [Prunus mume]|uniref:Uncharacterized protein LOC107880286 n=1 Tax=Prunus mume TaxID=102107 RepID=A0ABM1LI18_PRUMU|nr:PREDICTED: uncharacterized protein LOC107880286 [Prunus mume]